MNKHLCLITGACLALVMATPVALAADQDRDQTRDQLHTQDRQQIYGYQLMTQQERDEYRNRMRTATTAQERERIRLEHHKQMQERAKQRGMSLPDMMPHGMGGGMGPGGGGGRR